MTTDSKRKSAIVELKALAAAPSERTPDRAGYRAGHYPHSLVTRVTPRFSNGA